MAPILIIEDEAALASALAQLVRRMGFEAVTAASAELGVRRVRQHEPVALVVLDIGLSDRSGLDALVDIRALAPDLPVLVITAHGSLHNAVEAKLRGASAYLVKPLDLGEVTRTVRSLVQVAAEGAVSSMPDVDGRNLPVLIGSSSAMQPAFAAIAHAAHSDVPVLVTGPTGTGKSLAARAIHLHSRRRAGPFVTLACGSLPETLLEAELFGHEKGAFTGALAMRPGHLERAAGGTLLLDEIGEIPPAVQVKLLHFLDERAFTRVGGRTEMAVDLRIVAATNKDLERAVSEGQFREDLLYRLRVLEVRMPSLRERIGDLPALCSHLLARVGPERRMSLSADALATLQAHSWPGNVRELRNSLEHAIAVCGGNVIGVAHLPPVLRDVSGAIDAAAGDGLLAAALNTWLDHRLRPGTKYDDLHEELERRLLAALLPRHAGKPTLLARTLDMNRATLRKKLRGVQAGVEETDDDADG